MLEFSAALAAIKGTKELLTGALDAKIDIEVRAKVSEAREKIGTIQDTMYELRARNFDLLEENGALKAELSKAQGWQAQLDAYELVKAPGTAMVYRSKTEPVHYVCPSCLTKQEIHPLQDVKSDSGVYLCPGCKAYFNVDRERQIGFVDRDPPDWRTT